MSLAKALIAACPAQALSEHFVNTGLHRCLPPGAQVGCRTTWARHYAQCRRGAAVLSPSPPPWDPTQLGLLAEKAPGLPAFKRLFVAHTMSPLFLCYKLSLPFRLTVYRSDLQHLENVPGSKVRESALMYVCPASTPSRRSQSEQQHWALCLCSWSSAVAGHRRAGAGDPPPASGLVSTTLQGAGGSPRCSSLHGNKNKL